MRSLIAAVAFTILAASPAAAQRFALVETPSLSDDVAAGRLPPIGRRVPAAPAIAEFSGPGAQIGRQGGDLHILMNRPQDVRMMVVYGYARLVGYDSSYTLKPDLLESVDVENERVFTLHLRPGHKWSDGQPFTSADFAYWWNDIVKNKLLSPLGAPKVLLVDGKEPAVTFPNETTVRFAWDSPNPYFLPALAAPSPLYIFRPAHYLKQFHEKYADPEKLATVIRETKVRNWAQLHNRLDNQYRNDNPDLPTLEPWVVQTRPPADRFVFRRNAYYHRIDSEGRQLPYLDSVVMNIADGRILAAKTGAGEADLQSRGVTFANYTFLRQAAKRNDMDVRLWDTALGAQVALYPNMSVNDPAWRALNRDVRFRRALSLAINRHEVNQVIYFGLAVEGGNTLLPASPLYSAADRDAWAKFDLKEANRLLDEIGLTKRDSRGVRLLPDGRPLEIIIETAGEESEQVDALELIHDTWLQAGVKLYSKPSQREVFRNRIFTGETVMSVWFGVQNALPNATMSPEEFAPSTQQQLQWPKWGQFIETGGGSGEAVDEALPKQLMALNDQWRRASTFDERERIWREMVHINADQVYTIGVVAGVKQPVVVTRRLRNVPDKAVHNWDPGAFFGVFRPDTFWFAPQTTAEAK